MADVEQATAAVATVTMSAEKKAAKEAEAAASAANTSPEAILSWTTRYPAKLKAVVWNLKENSVRSVVKALFCHIFFSLFYFASLSAHLARPSKTKKIDPRRRERATIHCATFLSSWPRPSLVLALRLTWFFSPLLILLTFFLLSLFAFFFSSPVDLFSPPLFLLPPLPSLLTSHANIHWCNVS